MPVKPYWSQVEPAKDAMLWRFMDLRKFRDLMASEELYFRRADLFTDRSEGLPPEAYAQHVLGLDQFQVEFQRHRWVVGAALTLAGIREFVNQIP